MRPSSRLPPSLPQLVLKLKSLPPLQFSVSMSQPTASAYQKVNCKFTTRPPNIRQINESRPFLTRRHQASNPPSADRHQEPGAFGPTVSATWQNKVQHLGQVAAFAGKHCAAPPSTAGDGNTNIHLATTYIWLALPRLAKNRLLTLYTRCRFLTVDTMPKTISSTNTLFTATTHHLTNGRVSGCVKIRNQPRLRGSRSTIIYGARSILGQPSNA